VPVGRTWITSGAVDGLTRLALKAQAGDGESMRSFVGATYEQVWRLCAHLVDQSSADDLAQETFTRAVRALPRFAAASSARTWLWAIARHSCIDELRERDRRRRRDRSLRAMASVDRPAPDAGQEAVVADLLSRLEFERRNALVLTQILGLSYEEAAGVCGCPVGTIRSRVARARADLLAALGGSGPGAFAKAGDEASLA